MNKIIHLLGRLSYVVQLNINCLVDWLKVRRLYFSSSSFFFCRCLRVLFGGGFSCPFGTLIFQIYMSMFKWSNASMITTHTHSCTQVLSYTDSPLYSIVLYNVDCSPNVDRQFIPSKEGEVNESNHRRVNKQPCGSNWKVRFKLFILYNTVLVWLPIDYFTNVFFFFFFFLYI